MFFGKRKKMTNEEKDNIQYSEVKSELNTMMLVDQNVWYDMEQKLESLEEKNKKLIEKINKMFELPEPTNDEDFIKFQSLVVIGKLIFEMNQYTKSGDLVVYGDHKTSVKTRNTVTFNLVKKDKVLGVVKVKGQEQKQRWYNFEVSSATFTPAGTDTEIAVPKQWLREFDYATDNVIRKYGQEKDEAQIKELKKAEKVL